MLALLALTMPMFRKPPPKRQPSDEAASYWEIEVLPKQRLALLDLIRGRGHVPDQIRRSLETAVLGAREMDGIHRDSLPWAEIEDEAKREGCDVMDVLFDRMARRKPPQ